MGTRKKKRTRKQKNHIMSADELKQKGNEAFKRNEFKLACEIFTEAIELDATNHVLYSNRSAARAGNNEFDLALSDAEKVIELKPDFVKGYGRKGEFELAKKAYEDGLKVDAANDTCKDGIKECEQKLSGDDEESKEFTKMFSDPQLLGKLATNPKTRAYLQQPDFMKMFAEIQKDSNALQKHMNDPRVMDLLSVALGVNVMGGEDFQNQNQAPPAQQQQQQTRAPEPAKPKTT